MSNKEEFKIFIGCLPNDSTSEDLTAYLSKFCIVKRLKIRYRKNGICAGYGHALLVLSPTDFEVFLSLKHVYYGRSLEIRPFYCQKDFTSLAGDLSKRRLYVSGLPVDFTDLKLLKLFKIYGDIEKAYMGNYEQN